MARIVFIVLTIIGLPFMLPIIIKELKGDIVGAISSILQMILQNCI